MPYQRRDQGDVAAVQRGRADGRMANGTELGIPSGHGAHGAWRE